MRKILFLGETKCVFCIFGDRSGFIWLARMTQKAKEEMKIISNKFFREKINFFFLSTKVFENREIMEIRRNLGNSIFRLLYYSCLTRSRNVVNVTKSEKNFSIFFRIPYWWLIWIPFLLLYYTQYSKKRELRRVRCSGCRLCSCKVVIEVKYGTFRRELALVPMDADKGERGGGGGKERVAGSRSLLDDGFFGVD